MYYCDTPRDKWTALNVMVEETDATPPNVNGWRQEIKLWEVELEKWDLLQNKIMLDPKTIETKKDMIKWKIRSLEHKIAKEICALTAPVKEGDWDQPKTFRIKRLQKTGYI